MQWHWQHPKSGKWYSASVECRGEAVFLIKCWAGYRQECNRPRVALCGSLIEAMEEVKRVGALRIKHGYERVDEIRWPMKQLELSFSSVMAINAAMQCLELEEEFEDG